jgi:transposase
MGRSELERLSREELIELVLRLQRPEKTSRTSSKPPATDRKEQREQSKPGGAKPGHEGHSRVLSDDPDTIVQHRPEACACCGASLHAALPAEVVSVSEQIELPAVAPVVTQHQRLAVCCPRCGTRVIAPPPEAARGTPFGPGTVRNSVCGRRVEHQAAMALVKRSPKMTANCALAMTHSRGPIFHAFSERFKTR